ncbi:MAG TPA: hypothetical protein VGL63_15065 [Streptosporangiaceae bacterium]
MTGVDLVSEATAELYAADPDGFTERRAVLAGQARAAGEASAAKAIAGLRKPTRAAWTINQLVRADPGVPARLIGLGDELRAAEGSMDGARIRELSLARRQLIDALLGQALALSGQQPPPAALREEVTTTLAAALADPEFAEQLAAGVLLRAERRPGFGFMTGPALTLVPGSGGGRPAGGATTIAPRGRGRRASPAAGAPASGTSAGGALTARAAAAVEAARAERERRQALAAAAEAERAERERERRATIAEAEQALAEADQAAEAAAAAEHELENAVRLLSEQLDESRQKLIEIRLSTRRAKTAQRKAREALVRLRP